jgi:hypothetical protein
VEIRLKGKILLAVILLSALSLFVAPPQPLSFIFAFIQMFFLPGAAFSLFFLSGKVSRTDQVAFSLLLSPVIMTMLTVGIELFTKDVDSSVSITLAASYLLFIAALLAGRHRVRHESVDDIPRTILFVCLGYAGLILVSYLVNSFLLIRSDAWYHAAVVREVMERGIPPREPLLADFPIKYMWFYHLFIAVWIKRSGLHLFQAMASFNIFNAFIFPYLAVRYASYFTDKKYVMVLAAVFAIAGLDAAMWIFWPVNLLRAFMGNVTGMAEVKRIIGATTIDGTGVLRFLTPQGRWQVNWNDKFLTITALNYSFNLFLGFLFLVCRESFLTKARARSVVTLFLIVMGTVLFHIVTGLVLLSTLAGSLILLYLGARYIYRDEKPMLKYCVLLFTVILVMILAVPYFLTLVSRGGSVSAGGEGGIFHDRFHVGGRSILTILLPLLVLFFPAREAFRRLFRAADHMSRTVVAWIICVLIFCVFINIGIVGEKKFLYYLFIIIGTPIFVQIIEKVGSYAGIRKALLIAALLVLFLVPPVLTFRGFIIAKPDDELWEKRYSITSGDMAFFNWIEDNTPADAVFVEDNNYHLEPVYAGRRNFYSSYNIVRSLKYDPGKKELYKKIQSSLYGEGVIPDDLIADIAGLGFNLYIVVWREDYDSSPWLRKRFSDSSELFKRVYGSDEVSVFVLND